MTRDLFGFDAPDDSLAQGEVALTMVLHDQSPKGWLLGETMDRRAAQWAPKSQVRRGEGRDENVWTMPRWVARERGWL